MITLANGKYRYASSDTERRISRERHAMLRAAGLCINGPLVGDRGKKGAIHGPVVKGGRCQRCVDVWSRTR